VHAAAIGHGLAGDRRYGAELPSVPGLDRLYLHASSLELAHPATGDRIEFSAPVGERLEAVLAGLRAV
jgi:23S rRNA pseudouridine955/2504/2580 synthase